MGGQGLHRLAEDNRRLRHGVFIGRARFGMRRDANTSGTNKLRFVQCLLQGKQESKHLRCAAILPRRKLDAAKKNLRGPLSKEASQTVR